MRTALACLAVWLFLGLAGHPATAQTAGRYQAVSLPPSRLGHQELPNVLILDTATGHLWLWHQEATSVPLRGSEPVKVETFLNYMGIIRTGKKAGELIEKW